MRRCNRAVGGGLWAVALRPSGVGRRPWAWVVWGRPRGVYRGLGLIGLALCASGLFLSAETRLLTAERPTPRAESRVPRAESRAPSAERRLPSADNLLPRAEGRVPNAESAQTYGLGRPATAEEIRRLDVLIPPSGAGLPAGSGTAEKGKAVYAAQCARCHGATGREGPEDVLAGGIGSLGTARPLKTVGSYWPYATTLWDYVNRAMPFDRPGMLSPDEVYAVVAFMLQLNGIISTSDIVDATTLPRIRMPNRDGFVPDTRKQ